ncbi:hypothetical protein [Phenylobacterium montanum]|uniref:Uncharacterized protein n=1 Tax=Phenylobacterium montanum TaxID=2823693 RepID=A0A975G097_9CAUL|nr:hypothetical protein [Caulobacter sp. S6]QUD88540.1 hypothetical protein KCG34_01195 [Caulobacter sp. S6]
MTESESRQSDERFARAMARARAYLHHQETPQKVWPVLAAAGFFAVSSMVFATAAVMAPSPDLTHAPAVRGLQ